MALKTYQETPEEEAARINAASGDPDGITAEQVANNRALNENLTNFLGFGGGSAAAPSNPQAKLVQGVASSYEAEFAAVEASLPKNVSDFSKIDLENKISQASGGFNSGLNGLTKGNLQLPDGVTDALQTTQLGQQAFGAFTTAAAVASAAQNTAGDIANGLNKLNGGSLAGGLSQLAGSISRAAGQINNLLSGIRGANLPSGAELFTSSGNPIPVTPSIGNDWRVRINCDWTRFNSKLFERLGPAGTNGMVFPYNPNISFTSSAEYSEVAPTHNNYPFLAYKNSKVDTISIESDWSCETETDAAYYVAATTFLKTVTKMFYGEGANAGNPPLICRLTGYGTSIFNNVPVVVTHINISLPPDVNYIKCGLHGDGMDTWVPIFSKINIELKPIYNRADLRKFSLEQFALGALTNSTGQGYI